MTTSNTFAAKAEAINAATPPGRDRYMDFLRVASIAVVVVGHWLMAIVILENGNIVGTNALVEIPNARVLTWLFQVMPLFFFVGGFAHATGIRSVRRKGGGYGDFVRARTERLLRPTVVFLAVWAAFVLIVAMVGVGGDVASLASRVVVQPLWFVGVYLGVIALSWTMFNLHERYGVSVLVVLGCATIIVDSVRFGLDLDALGVANVVFVWLAVHQLGFFYADGSMSQPRVPVGMVVGGLLTVVSLTVVLRLYPVSMVGVPGQEVSNMSPPTIALAAHAVWLIGLAMMLRTRAQQWLARAKPWARVVLANRVVMTIFLWHLSALFLAYGALFGLGIDPPMVGGVVWWLTRPLWVVVLSMICAVLVAMFSWAERPVAASSGSGDAVVVPALAMAMTCVGVLGVAASGLDSLYSGRTIMLVFLPINALVGITLIAAGWWILHRYGVSRTVNLDKVRNEMASPT